MERLKEAKALWEPIIDLVKSRGALLHTEKTEHSYPHCWRCHNPVIFRATEQWFISMESPMPGGKSSGVSKNDTLRTRTLEEIKKVKWDPAWGEERLTNMIQTRPDWCISRQRAWGLPIPVFYNEKGEALLTPASVRAVAKHIEPPSRRMHLPADGPVSKTSHAPPPWTADPVLTRNCAPQPASRAQSRISKKSCMQPKRNSPQQSVDGSRGGSLDY